MPPVSKRRDPGKFKLAKGIAGISEKLLGVNLRRKLFKELHERFGGRLRLLISGGAAINPEVSRGFRELGIDFIQGYGMTEYAPIISVNRVDQFKDGRRDCRCPTPRFGSSMMRSSFGAPAYSKAISERPRPGKRCGTGGSIRETWATSTGTGFSLSAAGASR